MTLLAYPLVAVGGALVGSVVHEAAHAVAAAACGALVDVGWSGGVVFGGPFVDFEPATRWQSEIVRKAPLAVGLVAIVTLVVTYRGPTLAWVAGAAATLSVFRLSPEDLFIGAARQD